MKLIYELSVSGRSGVRIPVSDVPKAAPLPQSLRRAEPAALPEVAELDLVRHFTGLSRRNYSVDTNFYPLGSCTMKYNAKVMENAGSLFADSHPVLALLPGGPEKVQGPLSLIHGLEQQLAEITGMDEVTTQPLAGAHGEMTGIMVIAAYHKARGQNRRYVIVPDSSHGTNPASAAMAGYEIVTIPTAPYGDMDLDAFRAAMNDQVAAVMMTCPNTLGIFNPHIAEICEIAHQAGALVYYDGANLNAILGKVRPGDVGFDVIHVNLHKTFGTPHGGGGPGSGPVGVKSHLIPYLPTPRVVKGADGTFGVEAHPEGIGRVSDFFGNFAIMARAFAYITMLGREGLIEVSEQAVLNANYMMARLKEEYELPFDITCMHECVFSASRQLKDGVHAIDIAKYLIDRGFHPPTVYFPLNVKEAIMIEPTETESKQTMDSFIAVMLEAAEVARTRPEELHDAPVTTPVGRLDETRAARALQVCCEL
ncbi:aminomethyl-transferring glycine dehydrogenase subunit GcvPB [Geomesophilobacter sediminis]|uniref:glycine dehydrogenase (aminomethyl-transferring) n=1 Tax=Geomesophilobacter sediminis TaxID=2798584 RepID=A0A8J7LYS8_9BACT|nr:aminomethyl-transferring glycine dehydrogenase subunit GcvPB [Geomesophilobacter sediminis]MBJ6725392.1 aminomethyl-transferring glycine dehydrogenase subunit GcvPB [Geomesophilobacter sediminis]